MADISRKMLSRIRSVISEQRRIELPGGRTVLGESSARRIDEEQSKGAPFVVRKNDVQFGSVRSSQEDAIGKAVGDVKFAEDALKYYPGLQDLVIEGEVAGLGMKFQFRYQDPSGDGCYIWADGLQMTDSNTRTVEKVRDAFMNWKQSIVEDGDLLQKLHKEAVKDN